MSRRGVVGHALATLDDHVLRVVGFTVFSAAAGIISLSVTTVHGLPISEQTGATMAVANLDAISAILEFSVAHPAYPAAMLFGLVLLVGGDETPLLGS